MSATTHRLPPNEAHGFQSLPTGNRPSRRGRCRKAKSLEGARGRRATPDGRPPARRANPNGNDLPGTDDPAHRSGSLTRTDQLGAPCFKLPRASPLLLPLPHNAMASWWKRLARKDPERRPPVDVVVQSVVLAYIVAECPEGVSIALLARHFNAEFEQGIDGTAVECAVRELVSNGQLRTQGGKVVPDRAAWSVAV